VPQTPLRELTALPQTLQVDLKGLLLREGGKEGREGRTSNGGGRGLLLSKGGRAGGKWKGKMKEREGFCGLVIVDL